MVLVFVDQSLFEACCILRRLNPFASMYPVNSKCMYFSAAQCSLLERSLAELNFFQYFENLKDHAINHH